MLFGISLATFTVVHVTISLVGIVAGLFVMVGLLTSSQMRGSTALFLTTTILTSVTGFVFPFTKILPSHIVGIISLVLLGTAVFALYVRHIRGLWRPIFVVTAMLALYLNVFVLIIQAFLKVPALKALAPTQTELSFLIVQGAALLFFLTVTIAAAIKFRPAEVSFAR